MIYLYKGQVECSPSTPIFNDLMTKVYLALQHSLKSQMLLLNALWYFYKHNPYDPITIWNFNDRMTIEPGNCRYIGVALRCSQIKINCVLASDTPINQPYSFLCLDPHVERLDLEFPKDIQYLEDSNYAYESSEVYDKVVRRFLKYPSNFGYTSRTHLQNKWLDQIGKQFKNKVKIIMENNSEAYFGNLEGPVGRTIRIESCDQLSHILIDILDNSCEVLNS